MALQAPSSQIWGATSLDPTDVWNFEYFRVVCAKELSLFLGTDLWEKLIIQAASTERCILDGAVAAGALSKNMYLAPGYPNGYSLDKYNMALRVLGERLGSTPRGPEVTVLGSMIFVSVELLQGSTGGAELHLRGALAILNSPGKGPSSQGPDEKRHPLCTSLPF
ncbi:hypothetical protein FZEAL_3240 [Fusarium zealandicum]|uniref:Uncharacterized protein n=1 Tax=Fusarium zealandicum TaxID=1053134 RepID=A0A8H4UPJ9_9HYPO|nr:hypothetical protein FZEAL_3240 [Fusarium zealandicum]